MLGPHITTPKQPIAFGNGEGSVAEHAAAMIRLKAVQAFFIHKSLWVRKSFRG